MKATGNGAAALPHSQAKANFVSMPLDALNSAGAWLDKGLTNLAGYIDASWAGEGMGDAAEWITEKEKLANEKYVRLINTVSTDCRNFCQTVTWKGCLKVSE